MKQGERRSLLGAALLLATGMSAAAEQTDIELGSLQIDAKLQRLSDQVSTREVVTREEIVRSGATDLTEVLRNMNGVYIRVGGDGTPRVDIRGLRTRQVLFLLNGVPLNAAADGQFDPRRIPSVIISRVEVIRGASSVLYGPNGGAGVINIVTREGKAGFDAGARAEVGPESHRLTELAGSWGSEQANLFLAGALHERDGFPLSDDYTPSPSEDGDRRENSDFERSSFLADFNLNLSDRTRWGVIAEYNEGEHGRPPSVREDDFAPRVRYERLEDFEGRTLQTVLHHRTRGGLVVRPRLYYNTTDELSRGYDDDTFTTQDQRRSFTEEVELSRRGADVLATLPVGSGGALGVSGGWSDERWQAEGFEVGRNNVNLIDNDFEAATTYAATELEHPLHERVNGFAGLGWTQHQRDEGRDDDGLFYSGGVLVDLSETTLLRVIHSRQVRHPTLRDLYATDRGNPDLESERILHYEIGVERTLPFWRGLFSVAAFQADARDFIERDENGLSQNRAHLRFRGIETELDLQPTERFDLRFRYTLLDSENMDPIEGESRELQNRPRHRFGVDGGYHWATGTGIYASWGYTADNLTQDGDGNSMEIGDYRVLDVTLYQNLMNDQVRLYLRAENLLDENYEPGYAIPGPGRQIFGGIRIEL